MFKSMGHVLPAFALVLYLLSIQSALAQYEITVGNDFGVGARAMGMGGAFIGVADDYTALHWNPAGLSQIKYIECFGGLSHERLEAETDYFGDFESTFATKTRPNAFGIVLPVPVYQGGLAFAIGVNRLQSFDSRARFRGFNRYTEEEDPIFFDLFVDELHDESGGVYSWSFGAAVDIAPGTSLGASFNFFSGNYWYERSVDADDIEEIDAKLAGISFRDSIDRDYFGVNSKIGLLARPVKEIALGVTIEVPLDFSTDEYWTEDSFYLYDDGTNESEFDEGFWDYDISRPFRFSGGVAIHPVPGATVAADVTYSDWTQTEYSDPPVEGMTNEVFIEDYRDTFQFRLGGEYFIPSAGLAVRAGYLLDPMPYEPEFRNIETERQFITVGIGMMLERVFSLDIAYTRGFWKFTNDNVIGEDWKSNRIYLSAGYRF